MRTVISLIPTICLFELLAPVLQGEEYRINLRSNDEEIAVIDLKIDNGLATATSGDIKEEFDLKGLRWQDEKSGRWVSLSQCEKWASDSKEKSIRR